MDVKKYQCFSFAQLLVKRHPPRAVYVYHVVSEC